MEYGSAEIACAIQAPLLHLPWEVVVDTTRTDSQGTGFSEADPLMGKQRLFYLNFWELGRDFVGECTSLARQGQGIGDAPFA